MTHRRSLGALDAWHALLAPLPDDAVPERELVASPELIASGQADAIAGWESIKLHLSALHGLRHILVTIDAEGELLSAGDTVLFQHEERRADALVTVYDSESIGGRYWPDGSFTGTRWQTRTEHHEEGHETYSSTPSSPSAEDIAALNRLVAELLRRAPPRKQL